MAAGALALIALVGLLARRDNDEPTDVAQPDPTTVTTAATTPPPDPSTTSTTTTAPPARPAVDEATMRAEVAELSRFVERERGLTFQRPVQVEALGDTDFRARLAEMSTERRAADEARGAMLGALGVIPQDLDYAGQVENLRMNFLDGFYDPEADVLVVRLTEITPQTRALLVHELTHAVDDQWFELFRPQYGLSPEEIEFGFRSLVEGDAQRVEHAYIDRLPSSEKWNYRADPLNAPEYAGVEGAVVTEFMTPYELGEALVRDVIRGGGQPAIDQAFLDPPTTSEQVRYPSKYIERETRLPVDPPNVAGPITDEGVMGLLMTEDMLGPVVGEEEARIAAQGWGGDWFVSWVFGDLLCFTTDYVMETTIDLGELHDAFVLWAAAGPHRIVERPFADLVRVTACGPPPPSGGASPA